MLRASVSTAALLLTVSAGTPAFAQITPAVSLMPQPQHIHAAEGALLVGANFKIVLEAPAGDEIAHSAAGRLQHSLEQATGHSVTLATSATGGQGQLTIVVHHAESARIGGDESYSLDIRLDGAHLEAATSLGAVRGLATVRQLITGHGQQTVLPGVTISDAPLYPWRGVMIDCARHFIPMDALERSLDAMELVKLNVLHLHLSDNEGFRVESKVFPKLQESGSNGEFYTQAELRKLIHEAGLRGIVVVPEFDMPSHAMSWFAGYPELSSSPGPFTAGPLKYDDIPPNATVEQIQKALATAKIPAFDPSRESTYSFLDRFIGEMSDVFPAPYFHIGADENNGAVWLANPLIVAFMKEHQLADAPALQAYFVDRVNTLVKKHDRTMVAWEEAYAPSSKVGGIYQVWSPLAKVDLMKTPLPANDQLLLSKGFYLDLFYPAYVHYANADLPGSASVIPALQGGEGALWTEIADRTNVEARMWPRSAAIAERLWTAGTPDGPEAFYPRLFRVSEVLDREGVHNLVDYQQGVAKLAGTDAVEPVRTLLDVLTPLKGYKRLMSGGLHSAASRAGAPLDQVADVVLVDSETKYRFRAEVADFLARHDAASTQKLRAWLELWSENDARLRASIAHSDKLAAVAGHSQRLAALAAFTLKAMDGLQGSEPLSAKELAEAEGLLKAAGAAEGQTEVCVVPEIAALLHGALAPEPTSYPLF